MAVPAGHNRAWQLKAESRAELAIVDGPCRWVQDAEVERLKQVIAAQREREERRQRADCEAYERLKRGYAASKAESTPGGAAAALRAACRELKPLDLMRIFEAERANLQEAAAAAAAEARAAQAQLARAQVGVLLVSGRGPDGMSEPGLGRCMTGRPPAACYPLPRAGSAACRGAALRDV